MKISIALTLLVMAVAAAVGWKDERQLVISRERNAKLVSNAAQLGISINSSHPTAPVQMTKRERESRGAGDSQTVAGFMTTVMEVNAIEKNGGKADEATVKKMLERLLSLNPGELEILVPLILGEKDLSDESREGIFCISMMKLAEKHPQAALELLSKAPAVMRNKEE